MNGPRVLSVGYLSMDSITTSTGTHMYVPGGAALYAALGAQLAGAEAAVVAAVGDDYPDAWLQALERRGVGTGGVERRSGRTRQARLAYAAGTCQSERDATWWERTAALAPPAPSLDAASACIAGPMAATDLDGLTEQARRAAVPVAADTSGAFAAHCPAALLALVPRLWIFAPSREETRLLLPGLDDDAAALALARLGPHVLQKRGADGAVAVASGTQSLVRLAAPSVARLCDPTGAGDAAVGALAALMLRQPFFEAARMALAAGARAVSGIGPAAFGFDMRQTA